MNRRNFLKDSILTLSAFAVLPSAETYKRIWSYKKVVKPQEILLIWNPEYRMDFLYEGKPHYITRKGAEEIINNLPCRCKFENGIWREIEPFLPCYEWNDEAMVYLRMWSRETKDYLQ